MNQAGALPAPRRARLIGICHGPGQLVEALCTGLRADLARSLPNAVVTTIGRGASNSAADYDVLIIAIDPAWVYPEYLHPNDPVRVAIETAVARRVPLIPLLIDSAVLPSPSAQLPFSMREMMNYNAHTLRGGTEYTSSLRSLVASLRAEGAPPRRGLAWAAWLGVPLALAVAGVVLALIASGALATDRTESADAAAALSAPPSALPEPPVASVPTPAGSGNTGPPNSAAVAGPAQQSATGKGNVGAQVDSSCAQSCRTEGLCTKKEGTCVAASNADCRGSWLCRYWGRCTVQGNDCRATSDADCRASQSCARLGACALGRGECAATGDPHCKSAEVCRTEGRCTAYFGDCVATRATDCQASETCAKQGNCVPVKGHCVAG